MVSIKKSGKSQTTTRRKILLAGLGLFLFGAAKFYIQLIRSALAPGETTKYDTINPLLRHLGFNSDDLFEKLMMKGVKDKNPKMNVIEVGAHRLTQSALAASAGFKVLTFDASPQNFIEMKKELDELPKEQRSRITIHNKAVAAKSGQTLTFSAAGGTGDHVSGMDLDESEKKLYQDDSSKVTVKTVSIDDVISSLPADEVVYLLKVDVQGFEANVFSGLRNSIAQGKIRYILFEYWVDAIDRTANKELGTCSSVQDILEPLSRAGYELFDIGLQNHPSGQAMRPNRQISRFSPMNFYKHCQWFHQKSEEARTNIDYNMGYWTDILAVSKKDFTSEEFF